MIVWALLACGGSDTMLPAEPAPPLSLVEPLGPGQVRAGVVTDPAALFGGTSAEGRVGDVKMYNDRVQFIIQGVRDSSFYVSTGGTVVDADLVRQGHPGQDTIDELSPMFGLGRVLSPTNVEVTSDGATGEAVVRITGDEAPLGLIEGALESPGFVPPLGLTLTTEYRLAADSWLLEMRSKATAGDSEVTLALGDLMIVAPEVSDVWHPGSGMETGGDDPFLWSGFQGRAGAPAVALVAEEGAPLTASGAELLTELADMAVGFGPTVELAPGESIEWVRHLGVAPDHATISDAALQLAGTPTETVSALVTAPDGPVEGARVNLLADDRPLTVALTDAEGRFTAQVPAGATVSWIVDGRGDGLFLDIPPGSGPYAPYAAPEVRAAQLDAFTDGAAGAALARGRGVATSEAPLTLQQPGTLSIQSSDGLPFAARLAPRDPGPSVDERVVLERPDGLTAAGWSRDGDLVLTAPPGTYDLTVWRGLRYSYDSQEVTLIAGQDQSVNVILTKQVDHAGWILGDPHQHAAPSGDADIPMADRLIGSAAVGLQVHFGTDHDHVADYRPLSEALGLQPTLRSVVSDEVSPPLRGHFNAYPLDPTDDANGGAWSWWAEIVADTESLVDAIQARHGNDVVLQSNHPTDNGMAELSGWSPGRVGDPDRWTDRFGAVEVLNAGEHERFTDFYYDMIGRGILVAPTGVSDAHGHFSGHLGLSGTWFGIGSDDVADWSDDALIEAMRARRTIAGLGVFLDCSIDPGSLVNAGTVVEVEARTADWITVDRLHLLQDGVITETVEGRSARFMLDPTRDAYFVVIAEGDSPMSPISGRTPWAMTSAWLVDVGSDGWSAPLPPLALD